MYRRDISWKAKSIRPRYFIEGIQITVHFGYFDVINYDTVIDIRNAEFIRLNTLIHSRLTVLLLKTAINRYLNVSLSSHATFVVISKFQT